MKKIPLLLASSIIATSAANAQENEFFVNPFFGYGVDSEEIFGGLAAGLKRGPNEFYLQYGLMRAGDSFIDLDLDAISAGYAYVAEISDTTNYYLGGSVGLGSVEVSNRFDSADDDGLYFDLKIGLETELNDNFSLLAGIRYFYFEEPFGIDEALDDVSIEIGAKFTF